MDVAESIAGTLRRMDGEYVSFAELQREAEHNGVDWSGNYAMEVKPDSNIFLWFGMSAAAIDAVQALVRNKIVDLVPAHELTYMADGRIPKLPVAKSARNYKSPRWLPCTLLRGEMWDDLP